MFLSSRFYRVWIWVCSSFILVLPTLGSAQIVPDTDPATTTQTRVTPNDAGDRHTIDEGIISGDGTNLFHHFSQFDLPTGDTAVFDLQTTPAITNILNRVLGDNPSEINGALEILGGNNPNLFLINPAGVVFGQNASLNIPGDFTATTADAVQFEDASWLETSAASDYSDFNGLPTGFDFLSATGVIINGADLAVGDGKALNFLASGIVNTGTLSTGELNAPGGAITLTALPETGTVKLSQAGSLLNLEFMPDQMMGSVTPLDFAELLTGDDLDLDPIEFALGLTIENGILQTNSGISLPQTSGLLFSDNEINAGVGDVAIAGSQVGINGFTTGDTLNINADDSFVLLSSGNIDFDNGEVTITAPQAGIYGDIAAVKLTLDTTTGIEIAAPLNVENWAISVDEIEIGETRTAPVLDLTAPFGNDLTTGFIDSSSLKDSLITNNGAILSKVGDITLSANLVTDGISVGKLTLDSAQNITLDGAIAPSLNQTGQLALDFTSNGELTINQAIQTGGGDATFESTASTSVNADIDVGTGQLVFVSNLNIGDITLGSASTEKVDFQGTIDGNSNLTVNASEIDFNQAVGGTLSLNNITLNADEIDIKDNVFAIGELSISPQTNNLAITLGSNTNDTRLNLSALELSHLQDGFSQLSFTAQDIDILGNLTFSDALRLETTSGAIQFNDFALNAPEISLVSGVDLVLGNIETDNLTLETFGNITDTNPLTISGLLTINNSADVTFDNLDNDFNQVNLVQATNVSIQDKNHLTFTGSDISGNLQAFATSIEASEFLQADGSIEFETTDTITARDLTAGQNITLRSNNTNIQTENLTALNGNIDLFAANNIQTGNINATNTINILSQTGTLESQNISSSGGNVEIITADNLSAQTLAIAGALDARSNLGNIRFNGITVGGDADLFAANNLNVASLNIGGNLNLEGDLGTVDIGGVTVANQATISAKNNVSAANITAQDLTIQSESESIQTGSITTTNGSVNIGAEKNITTDNLVAETDVNLTSQTEAIATADITANNGAVTLLADTNLDVGQMTSDNGQVSATATRGNLTTGDITTEGQAIALNAGNTIQAGNLTSKSTLDNGGDITVQAIQEITTGNIDSSSVVGDAGNVSIDPIGDIETGYINAESLFGRAGNVDMTAGQHIRLTETFTAASGDDASISTIGGTENGEINLSHGGGEAQKFQVGDSSINGSAGALVQGDITIPEGAAFEAEIDTVDIKEFRAEEFPRTLPTSNELRAEGLSVDFFNDITIEDLAISGEELVDLESQLADAYIKRFNLKDQGSSPSAKVDKTLKTIRDQTKAEPAVVYAFFRPSSEADEQIEEEGDVEWRFKPNGRWDFQDEPLGKGSDVLELVMVTADGTKVRKRIGGATRQEVVFLANRFFSHVTNLRLKNAYLYSARELHKILVEPLEAELEAAGVDNLTYIMDSGLRVLPLAALHDGKQFLIEKYSVGTMPSFELTDTRYVNLQGSSVLAMGSSKFEETLDLPAVPLELNRVRDQVGEGQIFLNENFTVENLLAARRDKPHNIVHLATHGEFLPGSLDNSYIQFWDERLTLDDLSKLELGNPVVNLLVLSACRTALGNQDAELGFAGLAIASGAKSVLGSLWYVSDEGTLGLMTEFYSALKTAPIKADALRKAQLAMLRGDITFKKSTYSVTRRGDFKPRPLPHVPPELAAVKIRDFSHPYYWSSFNLVGNPW
ncbi:filamentous hemagglutinin family outer membrane protein [[Leptolyngbya] sp. PCC 7376]|uniref:CHAT domain-containing protein n=1 Tax=[Leptolyngbya] sp. PCC 7376 TaxID=111781 RepID=UPI00029F083E|nr:CHAT domain-containing protein [[Leptolyngbya] sp. PCC 7376]AFY39070.1 filamentous hemagglutinin family outer membrane protein [[Leptolyngbya] sp. PCC 7376]